jgi:uncharacterized protein YukE
MANEKIEKQDLERIALYMEQFRVNMEILESAIKHMDEGEIHIPNFYATLAAFNHQMDEITNTTAKRLYDEWQNGKY